MTRDWRYAVILGFLAIIIGVFAVMLQPILEGPWKGMYQPYIPLWLGVLLLLGLLVYYAEETPMAVSLLGSLIAAWSILSLSQLWGWPYGYHDVWAHYGTLMYQTAAQSPYPGLYWGLYILEEVIGISSATLLRLVPFTSSLFAIFIGYIGFSQLHISQVGRKRGILAVAPLSTFGVTPRPFAFVIPISILLLWWIITLSSTVWRRAAALILTLSALLIHPESLLFLIIWLVGVGIVLIVSRYTPIKMNTNSMVAQRPLKIIPIVAGSLVLLHLFYATDFGKLAVQVAIGGLFSTGGGVEASKGSFLVTLISNPHLIVEAVLRLSAILATGTILVISLIQSYINKDLSSYQIILSSSAIIIMGLFLFFDVVLGSSLLNLTRLMVFLPFVLLIPGVYAFQKREGSYIPTMLAIMVIVSGCLVVYPSLIGGIALSATDQQVKAVDWIDEYNVENQDILGSRMTFWVAQGRAGLTEVYEWSPIDGRNPKLLVTKRNGFAWQVEPMDESLIVVDQVSRAYATQEASESGNFTAVRELQRYQIEQSTVYSNGINGTQIYYMTSDSSQIEDDILSEEK